MAGPNESAASASTSAAIATPKNDASAAATKKGSNKNDAADEDGTGAAGSHRGRLSFQMCDALRHTAWVGTRSSPLYQSDSIKYDASSLPWPQDGLVPRLGYRSAEESKAQSNSTAEDARKGALAAAMEQMKEIQEVGWYPGQVYDPRRQRELVLEADLLASGSKTGPTSTSSVPNQYEVPFRHPNLTRKRYEVLTEESANLFLASKPAADSTNGHKAPPVDGDAAQAQPGPSTSIAGQQLDFASANQDPSELLSKLSVVERHVASFKEVAPRNDPKQGGIRVSVGVFEPQQEIAIGPLCACDVPGTGSGQTKEKVHVLNAGGTVYDLAWRPVPHVLAQGPEYLVISAADGVDVRTSLGSTCPRGTLGTLQVWALHPAATTPPGPPDAADKGKGKQKAPSEDTQQLPDSRVALDMLIHHEYGTAFALEWCPNGHDYRSKGPSQPGQPARRLGLLAGVFHDGTVRVFAVPHPDDVRLQSGQGPNDICRIKLDAALTLDLYGAVPSCLTWAGGEMLAAGCHNGHVAVWRTGDALRSGAETAFPFHFAPVDDGYISSISWSLIPYQTADGTYMPDPPYLPHVLFTTAAVGSAALLDLHDPGMEWSGDLLRERSPMYSASWAPQIERWFVEFGDNSLRCVNHRYGFYGMSKRIGLARGRITSMSASSSQPFLAYGSADGSVRLINGLRAIVRDRKVKPGLPVIKAFRLDHDRATGKLRMLENFMPEFARQLNDDGSVKAGGRSRSTQNAEPVAFHPSINFRAVAWNPNAGRAHILASGTGIGLVRIDRFEPGSVKMTGSALGAAEVARRKEAARVVKSEAGGGVPGDGVATSPEEEEMRHIFFEDLGPDANVVPFLTIDAQTEAQARADNETEYEQHLRAIRKKIEAREGKGTKRTAKAKAETTVPRKRGRPRKHPLPAEGEIKTPKKRGRPRKNVTPSDKSAATMAASGPVASGSTSGGPQQGAPSSSGTAGEGGASLDVLDPLMPAPLNAVSRTAKERVHIPAMADEVVADEDSSDELSSLSSAPSS
ncbi:hypothetical protein V8E36_004783 [Tilletia maclaganii]